MNAVLRLGLLLTIYSIVDGRHLELRAGPVAFGLLALLAFLTSAISFCFFFPNKGRGGGGWWTWSLPKIYHW